MGKRIKPRKNEAGYALVTVLILLIVAGLILVPLLLFMTTSIKSAQLQEDIMQRFYAADAGIEDAVYKIQNADANLPPSADDPPYQYTIADINGNEVAVTIEHIWILEGFEVEDEAQGTEPHDILVTTGHTTEAGTYQIDIVYDGSIGNLWINRIGVWLPAGFSYVDGTSAAVTTLTQDIDETVTIIPVASTALFPPTGVLHIEDELIEYSDTDDAAFTGCTRGADNTIAAPHSNGATVSGTLVTAAPTESLFRDGKAYVWDFDPAINFNLGAGPPYVHGMSFQFTPADEEPEGAFSWTRTNRHDIYLSWDINLAIYGVTATAGQTTVISYISGPDPLDIVTYTYESQ